MKIIPEHSINQTLFLKVIEKETKVEQVQAEIALGLILTEYLNRRMCTYLHRWVSTSKPLNELNVYT